MMLKHVGVVSVLMLGFILIGETTLASGDGLQGQIKAYKVVKSPDGKEALQSAEKAHPSDVILYRLTYKNTGSSAIKNVAIVDPIPEGMICLPSSATSPASGKVEFSIDRGESYHSWPVKVRVKTEDGREELKEATPDKVTHVRWIIPSSIQPSAKIEVSYRASVK